MSTLDKRIKNYTILGKSIHTDTWCPALSDVFYVHPITPHISSIHKQALWFALCNVVLLNRPVTSRVPEWRSRDARCPRS